MDSTPLGYVALLVGVVALVTLGPLSAVATEQPSARTAGLDATASAQSPVASNPCVGTISRQPSGTTLLSIQGARGGDKTVAMLVGIRPNGSVVGVHNGTANGRWWLYDVDRLSNGNLLLSTTEPGLSIVEELNPATGEHVSTRRFPDILDSHDADLINGDELLMNDMSREGGDRVVVYNLTREEIVWEYRFADHPDTFPESGGGEFGGDWTHNNDVEQIRPGVFMVSVRNFDQVVAIDRDTKEIRWTLGEDGATDTLFEQHNPDFIAGEDGTPTVLVADSLNDRVVEYARENGTWNRTWVLRGGGLDEPRDADRLPNGNTLVTDRRSHRLLEVAPNGTVVWEFYAPWQPYDAERIGTGDESSAPTARQLDATGVHEMTGSAGVSENQTESCYAYLAGWRGGGKLVSSATDATPTADPTRSASKGTEASALRTQSGGLPDSTLLVGGVVLLGCLLALLVVYRRTTDEP